MFVSLKFLVIECYCGGGNCLFGNGNKFFEKCFGEVILWGIYINDFCFLKIWL